MTKSVKFLVLLLVMILPIAGALLIGPISFGAELSKSSIVDKVELDHTTLYQGEMTSIKVSFSDKENQKIKPGDTITLTLSRNGQEMDVQVTLVETPEETNEETNNNVTIQVPQNNDNNNPSIFDFFR